MGFLLALTAVRLFPAGLSPLLFMCRFGRKTPVRCGQWGGVGERSICPVLSGLFPPACLCSLMHLSPLQDHKPACLCIQKLPSQLDWPVSPCSLLSGLHSMCCLKAVGSRTQNIFGGSWLPGQLQFQFLMVNSTDKFIPITVPAEMWRHTHSLQGWLALFNAFCSLCNHAVHAQSTDLVFACIGADSNSISNQYLTDLSKGCWVPLLQVCMGFAELGFMGGVKILSVWFLNLFMFQKLLCHYYSAWYLV